MTQKNITTFVFQNQQQQQQQIFEKLWRVKFLTIALSLKDIEPGLKSPMENFPSINLQLVAGWEYACLSQKIA